MRKRNRILYWTATIWLSLGMISTAIVQLIRTGDEVEMFKNLGYPVYLMTILAVWKILGVIAVLIPGSPVLKEWAYAGFAFVMSGAVVSHLGVGDPLSELFGPVLLLVLTGVSWYFRPDERKVISTERI